MLGSPSGMVTSGSGRLRLAQRTAAERREGWTVCVCVGGGVGLSGPGPHAGRGTLGCGSGDRSSLL